MVTIAFEFPVSIIYVMQLQHRNTKLYYHTFCLYIPIYEDVTYRPHSDQHGNFIFAAGRHYMHVATASPWPVFICFCMYIPMEVI